jgi:hypothetical protein
LSRRSASVQFCSAARYASAQEIDTSIVDGLYGKLLVVKEMDADGNVTERERLTTIIMR